MGILLRACGGVLACGCVLVCGAAMILLNKFVKFERICSENDGQYNFDENIGYVLFVKPDYFACNMAKKFIHMINYDNRCVLYARNKLGICFDRTTRAIKIDTSVNLIKPVWIDEFSLNELHETNINAIICAYILSLDQQPILSQSWFVNKI